LQQLLSVWSGLDSRRRVIVVMATLAMFAAVLMLSRMAATPNMALLYAGLKSDSAGEVIQALEQQGVTYEVRGGAIFVDQSRRDELRMTLASRGLPKNSTAGYELLDSLSGFGTTSQMFDAAYWRAKEGELARTIVSSPEISAARVHIANPSSRPFRREIKPTASVTVTSASGRLSSGQAKALKYLVASAVAGMNPDDVSIIDTRSGLIQTDDGTPSGTPAGTDREKALKASVERLLAAHVGPGNAMVEVSLETNTDQESIVEHRFDPDSRVAISTDTQEKSTSTRDSGGGASVTVASNLPSGNAAGDRSSSSQNSDTRERINYEVSETKREILRAPGAIKRLTIAVLVNGRIAEDDAGNKVFSPRSDEEIASLRELVASAVGFQEERGDIITLKSMEFTPINESETINAPSFMETLNLDILSIIQLAVLAVVSLVLGLFVVRPILQSATASATLPAPDSMSDLSENALADMSSGPASDLPSLTGEIADGEMLVPNMAVVSDFDLPGDPSGGFAGGLETQAGTSPDPVARLRQVIESRQEETVEILRGWMGETQENA